MNILELSELLGNWGEFIGAIAVVLTLIYLAVQVRQNSAQLKASVDAMQVTAYQDLMNRITELNRMRIESAEFAELSRRAVRDPSELSEIELERYISYLITLVRHADMAFMQLQKGMLTQAQYHSALGPFTGTIRSSSLGRAHARRVATSEYSVFEPEFRQELARLVEEAEQVIKQMTGGDRFMDIDDYRSEMIEEALNRRYL